MRKPQRTYQHEPLVTPFRWSGDERQFSIRLGHLIDDLYNKIGSLQGLDKDQIKQIILEYLEKNPPQAGVSEEYVNTAIRTALSGLPDFSVNAEDEGKVLTVVNGSWVPKALPLYDGLYEVTPLVDKDVTLLTNQKLMDSDVTVKKIPFFETSNNAGGTTVYIGSEEITYGK